MKITYDKEADAMYIYLAPKGFHRVARTETYQKLIVDLDAADQIVALRLIESDQLILGRKLKYTSQQSEIVYDEPAKTLRLTFAAINPGRVVDWSANVDMDEYGEVIGIEILFGNEFTSVDKIAYIRKYLISSNPATVEY